MALIKVKRDKDGKVFTSDRNKDEHISCIHFRPEYTSVIVQEYDVDSLAVGEIFCTPAGVESIPEVENSDHGKIISSGGD